MKLSIIRGGGVGGMVSRTELASESLSPEDARTLEDRVRESGLLEGQAAIEPTPTHPDEQLVELTVADRDLRQTVRLREGALPEEVRSLLDWADARPEREVTVEPLGRSVN